MASDPIHQFEIHSIVPIAKIGGVEIHFTNSALFMVITVAITALLLLGTTGSRRLVPTRMQSLAEMSYEFVANTLRNTAGEEGMKFFPLVFSLFMFILVSNVVGLIPYMFTVASQIIVTEGDEVSLEFVGINGAEHPTTIVGYDKALVLKRGHVVRVELTADKVGTFPIVCAHHRPSMVGELIVMPKRLLPS